MYIICTKYVSDEFMLFNRLWVSRTRRHRSNSVPYRMFQKLARCIFYMRRCVMSFYIRNVSLVRNENFIGHQYATVKFPLPRVHHGVRVWRQRVFVNYYTIGEANICSQCVATRKKSVIVYIVIESREAF